MEVPEDSPCADSNRAYAVVLLDQMGRSSQLVATQMVGSSANDCCNKKAAQILYAGVGTPKGAVVD